MARPIEATPVLRGEQARKFLKQISNPKPYKAPVLDLDKIHADVKKVMDDVKKMQLTTVVSS